MADLSILIAHKHDPVNDEALKIALDTIVANTVHDYELLVDATTPTNVYGAYNKLAERATTPYIAFTNSDVFLAPGWDVPMMEAANPWTIVTGVIVECGAIPVAAANVEKNFGMTPQAFRRQEFEQWVAEKQPFPEGRGWYFPSLHDRIAFLVMGGFDVSQGEFPRVAIDKFYWENWRASHHFVSHVRSYSYHLQCYSDVDRTRAIRKEKDLDG